MNRTARIVLSVFSLVGAAAIAHADQGTATDDPGCAEKRAAFHQKKLERFDLDHDGKLSDTERAQMRAAMKEKFAQRHAEKLARYDLNKDGVLDESERAPLKQERAQRMLDRLDANKDGQLSRDEVKCGPLAQRFDAIDTDKSGTLSKAELAAAPHIKWHHHGA